MRQSCRILVAGFTSLFLIAATPLPKDDFDPAKARLQLLALLDQFVPTTIKVDPAAVPGSPQDELIKYYQQNLQAKDEQTSRLNLIDSVYTQLIDAGLYTNDAEQADWQKKMQDAEAQLAALSTDDQLGKDRLKLGELAANLPGEFARVARMNAEQQTFTQFPPSMRNLLVEQSKIQDEITVIANKSPAKAAFEKSAPATAQTLMAYFAGKISLPEATQKLEDLQQNGELAYGKDVVETAKAQLNRNAVINTILAKSKGFKTHADFKVASQAIALADQFKTKDKLLKFLYGILDSTDAVTKRFYDLRAKQLGLGSGANLRPSQLTLMGFPTYLLVRDYFPRERHATIWKQTMIENGFPPSVLDHLILDVFPRAKKNSHAYMDPIQTPTPYVLTLNGSTLEPQPSSDDNWSKASIYILENFNDDGVADLTTAFHEGGHFLDYSFQRDPLGYPRAYGYAETHSTTMEYFSEDREFLLAHGETRDGVKIPEAVVDLYLKRRALSDLAAFRGNVQQAIYDIEVWDYDYEAGPLTFTERAAQVAEKIRRRAEFVAWPADQKLGPEYGYFITPHFRTGEVQYFGYVLAAVSAGLMKDSLYEKLKATTGRASFYRQPTMAKMLIDGIYTDGFVQPFPVSVEKFTGKKFSPDNFAAGLIKRVNAFIDDLEKNPERALEVGKPEDSK